MCSADQFIRQAALPTHQRGTRGAGTVVAIMDGASWLQELIDEQCPQAIRILDFAHAAGYLSQVADAAFGAGSTEATAWFQEWAAKLKTEEPEAVLAALRALPTPSAEAAPVRRTALRYLSSRRDQITYATFRAQSYPIGSGMVESAGKLVIEARLKGSGMRWASPNVNPLLALRGPLCSGQWAQIWPVIWKAWRSQVSQRRAAGRARRRAQRTARDAALAPPPRHHRPSPSERGPSLMAGPPRRIPGSKEREPRRPDLSSKKLRRPLLAFLLEHLTAGQLLGIHRGEGFAHAHDLDHAWVGNRVIDEVPVAPRLH